MSEKIVKSRHAGDTVILTVPKNSDIPDDTEFRVHQDADGTIVYRPLKKATDDLWSDPKLDDYDYPEILSQEFQDLGYNPREVPPVGK
ncbi:AbrB family toxin-antitoxin system antitoxin [Levilactobacillus angrenensis]|nr:AbrB family toxin-antitoxin system antitoxin [Levilactobacillus angrenensis]